MRIAYDKYTFTADAAAADTIGMGKLPKGARVIGYWLKCGSLDASGGTVDFGYAASSDAVEAANDDAFLANADVTSAVTFDHTSQANMVGLGKAFDAEVELQIKIEGDTDTTTGTVETCVFYVVD